MHQKETISSPQKIWLERYFGPFSARIFVFLDGFDFGLALLGHVLLKYLLVALATPPILGLNDKLGLSYCHSALLSPHRNNKLRWQWIKAWDRLLITHRENVRQLGAEAIAPTGHFRLIVVKVAAGQQMPENELRHVDLLRRVHLYRHCRAVVHHADCAGFHVYIYLDRIHSWVTLLVVRGVDKDLVKNLVQPRHVLALTFYHTSPRIIHPETLRNLLCRTDVLHSTARML